MHRTWRADGAAKRHSRRVRTPCPRHTIAVHASSTHHAHTHTHAGNMHAPCVSHSSIMRAPCATGASNATGESLRRECCAQTAQLKCVWRDQAPFKTQARVMRAPRVRPSRGRASEARPCVHHPRIARIMHESRVRCSHHTHAQCMARRCNTTAQDWRAHAA